MASPRVGEVNWGRICLLASTTDFALPRCYPLAILQSPELLLNEGLGESVRQFLNLFKETLFTQNRHYLTYFCIDKLTFQLYPMERGPWVLWPLNNVDTAASWQSCCSHGPLPKPDSVTRLPYGRTVSPYVGQKKQRGLSDGISIGGDYDGAFRTGGH